MRKKITKNLIGFSLRGIFYRIFVKDSYDSLYARDHNDRTPTHIYGEFLNFSVKILFTK